MQNRSVFTAFFIFALVLSGAATGNIHAQNDDCTRATPVPVVRKRIFPKTAFVLRRDKRTATETVKFANGDKLIITNAGCEYYYLKFRFETTRLRAQLSDTKYWFAQAVTLLEQTKKGINAPPILINDAIGRLKKYVKATQKPTLAQEIDYSQSVIRNFVSVDKIEKIARNKFALEVAFANGPL